MRLDRAILSLACALSLAMPAAQAAPAGWGTLDAGTQTLLAPWQDDWDQLPADARERLQANARRWQAMDANARAALLKRDAQWQMLPPTERARLRARYAAWQKLPPDEQARVRAAASRLASLPAPQRGAVRANFATQETNQRLAWLLGPSIGEWIEQANAGSPSCRTTSATRPCGCCRTCLPMRARNCSCLRDACHLIGASNCAGTCC